MTREEAIKLLKATNKMMYSSDGTPISDVCEALDMAIEALQFAEHFDLLKEYQSLQEVVRCKDCKWYGHVGCAIRIVDDSDKPKDNDYCSFGERKGGDDDDKAISI